MGWFSDQGEFVLTTRKTGDPPNLTLCTCKIESTDYDLKSKVDFEDSDDSDNESDDDMFDLFDDDDDVKAKIKWKLKKKATFEDDQGNQFAKLTVKVKGKSTAELDGEDMKSKSKTKKVVYHLEWPEHAGEGEELPVEFENGHWQDWDRTWKCGQMEVQYDAKFGTDEVTVKNEDGCHPCKALMVGSAMAYFFHPSRFLSEMDGKVQQDARNFMRNKG